MKVRPLISATSTRALVPVGDHRRRFVEVERNAEIAREMVERAERQDAERGLGPGKRAGGGADACRRRRRRSAAASPRSTIAAAALVRHRSPSTSSIAGRRCRRACKRRLDLRRGRPRRRLTIDRRFHCSAARNDQSAGPMRKAASLLPSRSRK